MWLGYGGGKIKLGTLGAYTITLTRPMSKKTTDEVKIKICSTFIFITLCKTIFSI